MVLFLCEQVNQVSQLLSQYHELLSQTLEQKDFFHEETKNFSKFSLLFHSYHRGNMQLFPINLLIVPLIYLKKYDMIYYFYYRRQT